jgi:hypothetical protein
MEAQKTSSCQSNPEQKEQHGKYHILYVKVYYRDIPTKTTRYQHRNGHED